MKLKRCVIAAAGFLLVATAAQAQYGMSPVLKGIGGGATLSDFSNPDSDNRWGGTAGLFVAKATYATLTSLEVNWIQKGGSDAGRNVRVDYLEIPVTFGGVGRTRNGVGRARLYGGVSVAFPISCKSDVSLLCDRKQTEWGAPFGLMVGRWSGADRFIGVDVRYTIPFSRAFDGGRYNQTWQFRLFIAR